MSFGGIGAHGIGGDGSGGVDLTDHLVQAATALRGILDVEGGGNHQHVGAVGPGLAHGREDVGKAGAGDGEADAGPAAGTRIAIGHEACALFVAGEDVADLRARQGAVHLDVVDTGNAEDRIDAIGLQKADQGFACGEFGT
jgi:hypothetical protein